ncbi:MAG: ComEA family DNA-binding protein [Thermodesulfobacteriota bacterium]
MKRSRYSDQHNGLSLLILILITGWAIHYTLSLQGIQDASEEEPEIFVGIKGLVKNPGVYGFTGKPCLKEVINRAEGLQNKLSAVDYDSYPLLDHGEMVRVSAEYGRIEISTTRLPAFYRITLLIPISINTASQDELVAIPQIGPVLARRIINHRSRYGPFTAVDELTKVHGIGKVRLSRIRAFVTI